LLDHAHQLAMKDQLAMKERRGGEWTFSG
jgi:hypothetical protein